MSRMVFIRLGLVWLLMSGAGFCGEQRGLTFYLPFDGNLTPQVAADRTEIKPEKPGVPVTYGKGVKGQALLVKDNSLQCSALGNLAASQGTICFWIKPLDWDPQKPETGWRTFWSIQTRVAGEGKSDYMSFWRYPESSSKAFGSNGAYNYAAQAQGLSNMIFSITDWQHNEWRFFAMSWAKDGLARLYQNGKLTGQQQRPPEALSANLNYLVIAGPGSALDEFKVFNSPLADDEVMREYLAFADASAAASENLAPAPGKLAMPAGPPLLTASPLAQAPNLDGQGTDPVWAGCLEVKDIQVHGDRVLPANETAFRFGYTADTLYGLVECASRTVKPKVTVRDHDGQVFLDDDIELFFEPQAGSGKIYQFAANAAGARYEGCGMDKNWNGAWEATATVKDGKWTLEFAIPLATLGIKPGVKTTLGFNLTRNDLGGNQLQSWADLGGGAFHNPGSFGRLVLGERAIGAAGLTGVCRDQNHIITRGSLRNETKSKQDIRWLLAGSAGAKTFRFEESKELQPGTSATVEKELAVDNANGWVGWRSMLMAGDTPLYVSPVLRSQFLRLPVLGRQQEPLVLENQLVRLVFDANTGALVSLRNLKNGRELLTGQEPGQLFRLDAVNFMQHPLFFREEDVLTLSPSLQTFRSAKLNKTDNEQTLAIIHAFEEGVVVTATIRLKAGAAVSKWEIAVVNTLPRRPRDGVIVHRVAYPLLGGLLAAEKDEDQAVALPDCAGRLVRSPAKNLAEPVRLEIPGWTSMSWMDMSGPQGGLYLASHDVRPAVQTILEAKGESAGKVGLSITRWSVLWPGKTWQPQPCSVGLHSSDWHWSADRYREWFYTVVTPRPAPQWLLNEEGWMFEGMENRYTCQGLPETLTRAQNMGLNYIQSWEQPGHFNIPGEYGWYLPNVYGGTEQDFKEAIREVHRRGGRVGFYLNYGDMEARLGTIMQQPQFKQKLSEEIIERMPAADPLSDGWLDSAVMSPDGSYRVGWPSGIDMWSGCHGSGKGFGPWYYYNLVTKHAQEYKADTWYADCHPGLSAGMCFNPRHAHKCPEALGQITLDFGEQVAKNVSKDFGILGEGFCDRFFTFQTHALWCMKVHNEDSEPAIFRYTHPQFPLFSGTCCYTWGGPSPRYTKLLGIGPVSFADHFRYMLLYGMRFDRCTGPLYGDPASYGADEPPGAMVSEKAERDIILLRKSVNRDLESADFRDQVGLSGAPARTQARVFIRRDRAGGLITIFDARPGKQEFTLSLRREPHGLGAVVSASVFLPGGKEQALPVPTEAGGEMVFRIPKLEARMLIVRFAAQAVSGK